MAEKLDLDEIEANVSSWPVGYVMKTVVRHLIARIRELERACQTDAARVDWLAANEAWVAWSRDGEMCRVFHRDEDGDTKPIMGWKCPWFSTAREAIDAAMSNQTQKGGERG